MITQEFRLKLYPKDFESLKVFYSQTLGFRIVEEWDRGPQNRGTMMDVGGTTLELLSPEDSYQPFAGFGISLEVPSVEELWNELKDKVTISHALRHNSWSDTSFQIVDPEGLKISFFTKD